MEKVGNQKKSDNSQIFGENRGLTKIVQLVDQKDMNEKEGKTLF